ncbi:hypothetical protein A3H22_01065 [Candidatus Peribacteria bacterium RIFCSPLOWO2_12_FULL_55_15]|nr:MAG: hypothetical protein A3E47_02480 [Candidatus Peribacteria bacterium RIFCSPHIGHO2_12_FULL_54_10]OGJ70133.1 MAG: hypothetical protein A3H22_01065 [Candidatus Peribacteria bacterium RIFCSPLOWO2_12_FULL_55_15]
MLGNVSMVFGAVLYMATIVGLFVWWLADLGGSQSTTTFADCRWLIALMMGGIVFIRILLLKEESEESKEQK